VSAIGDDTTSEATRSSGDLSLGRRFLRPRTLISLVIGLLILAFGLSRLQVDPLDTLRVMGRANWRLMLLALLVYYTAFPIRALRWRGMLRNAGCRDDEVPGVPRLSEIIYLSWFVNSIVPAKLGDVFRAYQLRQQSRVSFSKAGGTIVAERLVDLAVLLIILGVSGLVSFRGVLPGSIVTVLEVASALVLLAGVAFLAMRQLDPLVRRLMPARLLGYYGHFHEGVLGAFGGYPWLIGLTVLGWLAEGGRLLLVTQSVGLTLSPNLAVNFLMVVFIALGGALLTAPPGTPAGLGYVEATLAYVLTLLGATQPVALSVALLDRSISFLSLIVGGLIVYVLSQRHA
jgi:uncharacterized membrane protein YbhN (UPF0104 family)